MQVFRQLFARVRGAEPVGRYSHGRLAVIGVLALYVPIDVTTLGENTDQATELAFLWSIALLAPPFVAGRIMRRRLDMQAELVRLTAYESGLVAPGARPAA